MLTDLRIDEINKTFYFLIHTIEYGNIKKEKITF
jgi:hypothetical protein